MMTLTKELKPLAITALTVSCLTFGWQKESKAATFTVDDFTQVNQVAPAIQQVSIPAFSGAGVTATDIDTGLNTTNIVGGSRQLDLLSLADDFSGSSATFTVSTLASPTRIALANGPGFQSQARVTYDANGAFLSTDFSAFDLFQFEILSADLNLNLTLELSSGLDGGTPVTTSSTLLNVGAGTGVATTATFDLTGVDFSGLDLSDIDRISFVLSGPADLDAQIRLVQFNMSGTEIPEPSTVLSILGIGVLGRIASKKKKSD